MRRRWVPQARQNMRRDAGDTGDTGDAGEQGSAGVWSSLWEAAFETPRAETPLDFWGRAALWVVLVYYGWYYAGLAVSRSQTSVSIFDYILSMANLVFHEAGHIILIPLGEFMSVLGGSLFQVLIPLVFLVAFLKKNDAFAGGVMMWWTGQSLIELAPYIADARAQRLVLLGGVTGRDQPGYHDWNNLLTRLDGLSYDETLAAFIDGLGTLLIVTALLWGAYLLLSLHRQRQESGLR